MPFLSRSCPIGDDHGQNDGCGTRQRDQSHDLQVGKGGNDHDPQRAAPQTLLPRQQQCIASQRRQRPLQTEQGNRPYALDQRKGQLDNGNDTGQQQRKQQLPCLALPQQEGVCRQRDDPDGAIDQPACRAADHQPAQKGSADAPQPVLFGHCQPITQSKGPDAPHQAGICQHKCQQKMPDAAVSM